MLEQLIDAAIGRKKAEIVLKNGRFVNVFTGEICEGDIAIEGGKIVGFGKYEGETEYDIAGKIAVPGLIDAHVHIESSQLSPEEFARLVLPRGTTTVIADRTRSPMSAASRARNTSPTRPKIPRWR